MLPRGFERLGQAVNVHGGDQDRAASNPAIKQKPADASIPHLLLRTGEVQQRKHRERQLQREHDLAERQQVVNAAVAADADDENRRE